MLPLKVQALYATKGKKERPSDLVTNEMTLMESQKRDMLH